jgi:hypothetical protein
LPPRVLERETDTESSLMEGRSVELRRKENQPTRGELGKCDCRKEASIWPREEKKETGELKEKRWVMKREEEDDGVGTDGEGSKSDSSGVAEERRERWPQRRPEESEVEVEARWRREARAAPEMERS